MNGLDGREVDVRALLDALGRAGDEARIAFSVVFVDTDPPEVAHLNETANRLFGDGPNIWQGVAPEDHDRLREMLARRRAGEPVPPVFEAVIVNPDGQRIPSEVSAFRTTIGHRPATVVCVADVSGRLEATAALAASEARFRNVVESAPDGVAIIREGRYVYVNRPAAHMLGCKHPEDVVGVPLTDLLEPAEASRAQSRIGAMLQQGQRHVAPAEYVSRRLDGRIVHVEISSIPIEYEGLPAVLGFARDVTERRAMQERLLQADRLAAVGTLAAGVAHEINNPLAYSMLSLEAARQDVLDADLPAALRQRLQRRLDDALHGANRVATIVRDLKVFARPTDADRVVFDVNTVVSSALRVANNELRHSARITTQLDCRCQVHGNPLRLEQAILNLLVNAAQAVDSATTRENVIVVNTRGTDEAEIEIRDNGPGIDPEILPQIFDPFFTTKPVGIGTGLGLPTCRSIVELHGGTIVVESTPGEGTTFRVRLPRAPCDVVRAAPRSESPGPTVSPTTRLLVVDDESTLGMALQAALADDFDITYVCSGEDALREVESTAFDAVLCDVMMPGMGGLEFYERLKTTQPQLAPRVVFMTGGVFTQDIDSQLGRTGNPMLAKPFRPADARRVVGSILSTR